MKYIFIPLFLFTSSTALCSKQPEKKYSTDELIDIFSTKRDKLVYYKSLNQNYISVEYLQGQIDAYDDAINWISSY